MTETEKKQEKLILVGITLSDENEEETESCLEELDSLIQTAGGRTVGKMIQNRENPHPGTYLGSGKVEELRLMVETLGADGVVCDDELSPAQLRNLTELLPCKVMDRTLVILDIFAARATSGEGKLQVELAQLKYRATRLTGMGTSMSRLGGGIGTRGPGEKKLEVDRRRIHERIGTLKAELRDVAARREMTRAKRKKANMCVAAIVGYTNAGKSTLLNALTGAQALAEDKLFATLDPLTRKLELPDKQEMLLTDTVGFIDKLPHNLVESFKSTLEEAVYADFIVHVVDASDPRMDVHMHVVYETLRELGAADKPILTVFNKMDRVEKTEGWVAPRDPMANATVEISAVTHEGFDEFQKLLAEFRRAGQIYVEKVFDYHNAGKIAILREKGQLVKEEYTAEGIAVEGWILKEYYHEIMS